MNILKRLHHRPPYLLINEVHEHSAQMLIAKSLPLGDEFYLKGHFPGSPIVPGAILQEMTTQAAGLLLAEYYSPVEDYDSEKTKGWALGVLRTIHHSKYKNFARPGDELTIHIELIVKIENSFQFKARIENNNKAIMFNEFTLVNIEDNKLTGK